ncbi:Protein disulfide-isomerase A5 [Halotydeus destructor]|nr:Protein disulfide-isomerase A5 [Halotydeus destructor]
MSQRNLPPSFWNMNHNNSQSQQLRHHQASHQSLGGHGHHPLSLSSSGLGHHGSHSSSSQSPHEPSSSAPSSSSSFFIPPPPTLSGAQSSTSGPSHELYSTNDPYHPSARYPIHHAHHAHHQSDPWHYSLSTSAASSPYSAHHRAATSGPMHDLGYSSASNRFNAQYSSLLLQPSSIRSTRLAPVSGACGAFDKTGHHATDMSWLGAARYHHDAINFAAGHHSIDPTNYSATAAYGAAMTAAMSGVPKNSKRRSLDEEVKEPESLELPDKIEVVDANNISSVLDKKDYVAVLFYEEECELCDKALHRLEEIDDDADEKGIGFVKISDQSLAFEYGLEKLPVLVYYRKQIPIVYDGNLEDEQQVLNWLIEFRDTANDEADMRDDKAEIEDVSAKVLEALIDSTDVLAVLFYDETSEKSRNVLRELEFIDDETDNHGILFVKIDDLEVAKRFGIDPNEIPSLVYFEDRIPNFYVGDLLKEKEVLDWLIHQKGADEIEDVSDAVLHQLVQTKKFIAVLFYDRESEKCLEVLKELENIDDELDSQGLPFIKIDDDHLAREYGIDDELPVLIYFEKQIPSVYQDDLKNEEKVLAWLTRQLTSDEIEEVTDKMLDALIERTPHIAVLFYNSNQYDSVNKEMIKELEHIDDDTDRYNIVFVKTDDLKAAVKYGVRERLPAVVFFENEVPVIYEGVLSNEEEVLSWLIEQQSSVEIEDINSKTLASLIENAGAVAVLFYDNDSPKSATVLKELENIDDDCDKYDIPFVKIDDDRLAKEYGVLDELPLLVYFENKLPTVYEGDLHKEEEVLSWLVRQRTEDTIEEVTEEILVDLIKTKEFVLVFFAPDNCKDCAQILHNLEHIDDETDDHGILFVTTDDVKFAKDKVGMKKFPALVLFRNSEPVIYKGNLHDEQEILTWTTSSETLVKSDEIESVNGRMLDKLLDRSVYVAVVFVKEKSAECDKTLAKLETIDHIAEENQISVVKINDLELAQEYGISVFPTLIFFKNRFPSFYDGDLKEENKVLEWMVETKGRKEDVIELVDRKMLQVLISDVANIAVFFYDAENCPSCVQVMEELEHIDDDTDKYGIHFVKTEDITFARDLGISNLPALVYFEEGAPSIYDGDLLKEEQVLEWLIRQKTEDTIENVNRDILFKLIAEREYLAVVFYLQDDDRSNDIIEHLENIDDDCGDYEVHLVKIYDNLIAKKYGIRNPPGLVFFRRGKAVKYDGDMLDEIEVLEWLTRPENMESSDAIERVNRRMFERLMCKLNYMAVLFYSRTDCKQCERVLEELEKIDDEADSAGIKFVKVEDMALGKAWGVFALPSLVFFKKSEALDKLGETESVIFAGDLKKGDKILEWLISQKDPGRDKIEEVDEPTLRRILEVHEHVTVFFYTEECTECATTLEDLENIDTETDKHGIVFVKTSDSGVAIEYGCKNFPSLIYFEKGAPSVYEGDISAEEDVLQWLIQQKTEDTIESVNRELMEQLVESSNYLVVFFYKPHCRACDIVLEELEHIDDECDIYGIHMVKINDILVAKRYGIRTFPALLYFRNGNPLLFDGDLRNEDAVLEWLVDDDNRELQDEIEDVNGRMLDKLADTSPLLAVYFYDDECTDCPEVLASFENIDHELDVYGIDFVKVNDQIAFEKWAVHTVPALGFFRKKEVIFYDGDLTDEEKVLAWLTSEEIFELKDEIEEVNKKMLDKLLNEQQYIAVYFYENDCYDCEEILKELERIDDEADDLEIMFVKIRDSRYARKYGIATIPTLVFFRKKFPSVYRGDLMKEEEVLEWLRKNRYRSPEVSIFMYTVIAVTIAFILYTAFLFCFLRPREKKEQ